MAILKVEKPIYDTANHKNHKDFTSQDHLDAAKYHDTVSKKSISHYGKETVHSKEHKNAANDHETMAKRVAIKDESKNN